MPPVSNGPLPENQTPGYKAAKMAVIVLSILIVLAVMALIIGGITRLGGKTATHSITGIFQLPAGARIVEMQSQPGRLCISDRKSTHLNSSHRCISYAVLCMKKKNQSEC